MAITWTFEQGNGDTNPSVAYPSNVKAGSILIAGSAGDSGVTPADPTDSLGNTYTQLAPDVNDTTDSIRVKWWYAIANGAGANTISFTNYLSFDAYIVGEWSCSAGTITLDQSANGNLRNHTGATDNIVSNSIVTTSDEDLIIGFNVDHGASVAISAGTGFTKRTEAALEGFPGNPLTFEDLKQAVAGSIIATYTADVSGRGVCFVASFKSSAAGTPPITDEAKYRHNVTPMTWR